MPIMMRTRSTQWDGDPWEQSKEHDTEKEITKKNVQSSQDLRGSTCCNCDLGEQFMVRYHVEEILKQDWRFCNMKVYAHRKRDLYNYGEEFLGQGGCSWHIIITSMIKGCQNFIAEQGTGHLNRHRGNNNNSLIAQLQLAG